MVASTTDNSFDAMSIICRCEAPPGTGRVEKFSEHDGSVYSLQCLVGHAVTAQHVDDVQWLVKLRTAVKDDISDKFTHGELICDGDAEYFEWRHSLNARQHGGRLKARLLRRQSVTIISLDFWQWCSDRMPPV